uniref:K-box domain-containing protein n=1 Tax=Arundo donax TaxID=35708 RepID=A0A0A9G687_ARUDO
MERILDRYERHLLSKGGDVMEEHPELQGNMCYDHIMLRSRIEALQKSQRNLMGEQLDSLTLREIQQLERQIDSALRNIRSRKNHVLLNTIRELQQKERLLMEQNTLLKKEKADLEASLNKNSTVFSTEAAVTVPNLNIGAGDSDEPGPVGGSSGVLPWWMLRPSADS